MPCLSPNSGEIKRKCRQAEQKNEKDSLLVSNEILKKTNILLVKNGTKKKKSHVLLSLQQNATRPEVSPKPQIPQFSLHPDNKVKLPPWSQSWISVNEIKLIKSPLTLLCTSSPLLCSIISRAFHCATTRTQSLNFCFHLVLQILCRSDSGRKGFLLYCGK